MNKLIVLVVFLSGGLLTANAQFDEYFYDKTMRFDFYHCGDKESQEYFFDELKEEPFWAGSKISLIDDTGYGGQLFKILDASSGNVIYSRTYCTLFNEWQTTQEAVDTRKCMPESVVFPYPKKDVKIEFYARDRKGVFEKRFTYDIKVNSYFVKKFTPQYEVFEVVYNGNPEKKVDIVLLPEGYNEHEKDKFMKACDVFADEFFSYSPFKENRSRFNVRAVWAPSKESGVTIPGEHVWKQTALKAGFYTFDSERYQMIEDFQNVRDIAAHVPYEYIYVLSNTQKYGGGGIYNFYGISAANHPDRAGKIYVHEFGHVLLGLGDEYVGGVSYNDMYPLDVEPWEANLTTLVAFDTKDWKKMIEPKTQIPTLAREKNAQVLGVYEGGGYVEKGVYRPWPNCMMNNLHTIDVFCPVCKKAIQKQIDFLCE